MILKQTCVILVILNLFFKKQNLYIYILPINNQKMYLKTIIFLPFLILLLNSTQFPNFDISHSKILQGNNYQYNFKIHPHQKIKEISQQNGILKIYGNFSTVTIFHMNNSVTKYEAEYLLIRLQNGINYKQNNSADVEIDIVHRLYENNINNEKVEKNSQKETNTPKVLIFSQIYLKTKFISKVSTNLSQIINSEQISQNKTINLQKLLKIDKISSILMHLHKQNGNILFLIKKQFILINQQDTFSLKNYIKNTYNAQNSQFNYKNIVTISQFDKKDNIFKVKQIKQIKSKNIESSKYTKTDEL